MGLEARQPSPPSPSGCEIGWVCPIDHRLRRAEDGAEAYRSHGTAGGQRPGGTGTLPCEPWNRPRHKAIPAIGPALDDDAGSARRRSTLRRDGSQGFIPALAQRHGTGLVHPIDLRGSGRCRSRHCRTAWRSRRAGRDRGADSAADREEALSSAPKPPGAISHWRSRRMSFNRSRRRAGVPDQTSGTLACG